MTEEPRYICINLFLYLIWFDFIFLYMFEFVIIWEYDNYPDEAISVANEDN